MVQNELILYLVYVPIDVNLICTYIFFIKYLGILFCSAYQIGAPNRGYLYLNNFYVRNENLCNP